MHSRLLRQSHSLSVAYFDREDGSILLSGEQQQLGYKIGYIVWHAKQGLDTCVNRERERESECETQR